MGQYVKEMYKKVFGVYLDDVVVWAIKAVFVLLAGGLNLMNISVQGTISIIFSIIFMTPFLVGFVYSMPNTDMSVWLKGPSSGEINWAIYVSTLIWLHTGRDVMGCMAGEAGFAPQDFIKCFAISIVMDWAGYTFSLLGAFTVPYRASEWKNGYLIDAYNQIIPGMQWFVVCGALFSFFSLYFMQFSAHVRMMWAISQKYIIISGNGQLYLKDEYKEHLEKMKAQKKLIRSASPSPVPVSARLKSKMEKKNITLKSTRQKMISIPADNNHMSVGMAKAANETSFLAPLETSMDETLNLLRSTSQPLSSAPKTIKPNRYIRVEIFPEWVGWEWERTGSPVVAVVIQTIVNLILVGLPFDQLVLASTIVGCFTYLTEFTAFIVLKYTEPDAIRPYTVPGGLWGAWAVTITKVTLVFVVFGMTISQYPHFFFWCVLYDVILVALFYLRNYFFPDDNPYIQIDDKPTPSAEP
ncbi:amino acid transporter [Reticulomyxa filosa]|uniref:Amino acid transporter n=1 Tax=Reticulomyxa filosa TaxID=46433 RepID=X6MVX4_RETFI|nr:amino acid transporter [Reticulomyxa filosa]|eukprot:ETO17612.1 amino acid transporter [Reticulomyxa filosa]